jgi:serine/threonine-protein kinase
MLDVKEGDVLAGKYRIERVLGVGGMGVVVSALHLQLDERVAIKFLLPGALHNAEAVARFAREARAAVKIKSEHVARVSDVGTLETGAPYMVMEFLQGRDLAALVRESGPLASEDAAEYVLQACEALAEAHALGIVHRDLKPANLFLVARADGSPCVKVLDFGISKLTSTSSSGADLGMTKTHAIMGSPLYMSPEQMSSSRSVDARADIWAIGAILYELVTGSVPFEADSMPQLCGMILQDLPTPPRSRRADLPDALERTILRCLEKDRTKRFQSVAELAAALAPLSPRNGARSAQRIAKILSAPGTSTESLMTTSAAVVPAATNPTAGTTQNNWGQTLSKTGGRALWLLGGAGLIAVGGALALWLKPTEGSRPPASESAAAPPAHHLPSSAPPPVAPSPALVAPIASVAPGGSAPMLGASSSAIEPAEPVRKTAPVRSSEASPRRRPPPVQRANPPSAAAPAPDAKPAVNPLAGRH